MLKPRDGDRVAARAVKIFLFVVIQRARKNAPSPPRRLASPKRFTIAAAAFRRAGVPQTVGTIIITIILYYIKRALAERTCARVFYYNNILHCIVFFFFFTCIGGVRRPFPLCWAECTGARGPSAVPSIHTNPPGHGASRNPSPPPTLRISPAYAYDILLLLLLLLCPIFESLRIAVYHSPAAGGSARYPTNTDRVTLRALFFTISRCAVTMSDIFVFQFQFRINTQSVHELVR